MSLLILNQLPAIHATLVGLGGSLFGVYALFSTEKRHQEKERCKAVVKKLASLTLDLDQIPIQGKYTMDNGDPNWDLILSVRNRSLDDLDGSDALDACYEFVAMLYDLMTRYRFSDNYVTKARSDADTGFSLMPPSIQHCDQFMSILVSMRHFVARNKSRLVASAIACNRYSEEIKRKESEVFRARVESGLPPLQTERLDFFRPLTGVDYYASMDKAFGLLDNYFYLCNELLAGLRDLDGWNKKFPIKSYSMYAILSAVYVVIFGVVLPLVLLSLADQGPDFCQLYKLCWSGWMEYAVLILTFFPYIFFAVVIFKRLLNSESDPEGF